MLEEMNQPKRRIWQPPPRASKEERWLIKVLNEHIGEELETARIGQLCNLKRDTALKILERLGKSHDLTSRMGGSDERKPGKHGKTRVRIWTCHSRIVPRMEA